MAAERIEVGDRVFVRRHQSCDLNVGLIVGDAGCPRITRDALARAYRQLES